MTSLILTGRLVAPKCNYNSQQLKDEVLNFIKGHCLIGDFVEGSLLHFVDRHVLAVDVDHIAANLKVDSAFYSASGAAGQSVAVGKDAAKDSLDINVVYMATVDGRIIKMSNLDPKSIISEWQVTDEPIKSLKIRPVRRIFT